ncbi:uroporphyrin-III C-methyltransferase / precorrin-2 dehydrogenase / sirohydrochlorin ferrochelatase [Izhakiella capsodis]|uniref:Siroheme synthase n=1 Tax=Izhakiella capsodis TaxID=1367852 RepID=A0A1I4WAA7_9GAMM|nr:siroheme synthase CysG [Izhakiella capsodis]SFN10230.1 uroporphyrin-III C-methyltransferase / precorrin-2 dehydrogenase / sirohydrochlorin ferrochelatase [Izhakiella capsodis]
MNYLPLFADLRTRAVLVVGGGDVAARKIDLLRRAGACVRVVARSLCDELAELEQQQVIIWLARDFAEEQLKDVVLVIAATDDNVLNSTVSSCANARNLLVNVVDDQAKCSFIFPSIVDRSPLVVAISSGGTAPVLARLLREKLEALLPVSLGNMAALAAEWRGKVKQRFAKIADRRRYWERIFSGQFASQVACSNLMAARQTLDAQLENPEACKGEIILVGAGPGDPGLLTLRALQVMQQADVVLYDHLVSAEVLDLVRRDADRICVGKRAGTHDVIQEETNRLLVELACEGKRVVRLKGGDPFIFGRGGEELQVVVQAGIPFQIVPGVTAASGATAYAGIPLTHRDYAQSVLFITGHSREERDSVDWSSLARAHQTLAIYMGTFRAEDISSQLIAHGRGAATPVAIISRGTRPDQQVLTGTLSELGQLAQNAPTPALLVIGEVVNLQAQLAWFQHSARPASPDETVVTLA